MTMGAKALFDSMHSVDSISNWPPGQDQKSISSLTAQAVQVCSVTRATAANLIPVVSHKYSQQRWKCLETTYR